MKALVIGAARSGTEVSRLLMSQGYKVTLTDSKLVANKEELEQLSITVYDEGHPAFLELENWDFIVKNPGIPYTVPFVERFVKKGVPILNEIEVASRYAFHFHYGAITGTNGKTTTTTILAELLRQKNSDCAFAAGNIGVPLSTIVIDYAHKSCDIALEIAAFQLVGCPSFHPEVSVCMNLSPDHVDYFGTLEQYYEAKMLVYRNQCGDDWFLRNIDDEEIVRRAINVPCQVIDFSLEKKTDLRVEQGQVFLFDEVLFDVKDLHLVGQHNLQNAMVAAAMAYKMGVSSQKIKKGIQNFKGVAHRIEFVSEIQGVKYYNDSKGTNVDATIVALKAFDQPVILLAGGYDKKTGFDQIKPYLNRIQNMIVYGETKDQLKKLYPDAIVVDNLYEAVEMAKKIAQSGDVVLFSPICASWDQFENFEQRGDLFKQLIFDRKDNDLN